MSKLVPGFVLAISFALSGYRVVARLLFLAGGSKQQTAGWVYGWSVAITYP